MTWCPLGRRIDMEFMTWRPLGGMKVDVVKVQKVLIIYEILP